MLQPYGVASCFTTAIQRTQHQLQMCPLYTRGPFHVPIMVHRSWHPQGYVPTELHSRTASISFQRNISYDFSYISYTHSGCCQYSRTLLRCFSACHTFETWRHRAWPVSSASLLLLVFHFSPSFIWSLSFSLSSSLYETSVVVLMLFLTYINYWSYMTTIPSVLRTLNVIITPIK